MIKRLINKIKVIKFRKKMKENPNIVWDGEGFLNCEVEIDPLAKATISQTAYFRSGCVIRIRDNGLLKIGNNVSFNNNCIITCREEVLIGNNVLIGPNVLIFDHDHDYKSDDLFNKFKTGKIVIEDDVWIGGNCVILRGSVIHKGAVIGAGSVIKGEIPEKTVVTQTTSFHY